MKNVKYNILGNINSVDGKLRSLHHLLERAKDDVNMYEESILSCEKTLKEFNELCEKMGWELKYDADKERYVIVGLDVGDE